MSSNPVNLVSKALGPLPIINLFLERLRMDALFEKYVPRADKRMRLAPAVGLDVLLRNVLVARQPLYGLGEWAHRFDVRLLGLAPGLGANILNDDRVGRCLDHLFVADRAAMMTEIVVHAVRTFGVDLTEIHNDSTTVTFTGQYVGATGRPRKGKPTHRITFGHNKDHRPDLKQLLWILTTSADGAVPIWCSVGHGNTTDDQTHIDTWNTVAQIVGNTSFLYVADSKLCTKEQMSHIAGKDGRFVTVLPKTRAEDKWFRDWIQTHPPDWVELVRTPRGENKPANVYRGFEAPLRSVEGYRILWMWSSQKVEQDQRIRRTCIERAIEELERLRSRMNAPRSRLRTRSQIETAAVNILEATRAARWLGIAVRSVETHCFKQARSGRPNKDTPYTRHTVERFELHWQSNAETLQYDDRTDGIFPLVTNDNGLSLVDALSAYKHQPTLEKRHEQLKTVYEIMPVNLKSISRIEAFLFVYFLALLVEALIERAIREQMTKQDIESLPLYPEGRPCKAPTANRIFEIFGDVRRHVLVDQNGAVQQRFYDELTGLQRTVLKLLGHSPSGYFQAGDLLVAN